MLKIAFLAIFILKFCHAIEVDEDVLAPSISVNAGSGKTQLEGVGLEIIIPTVAISLECDPLDLQSVKIS